MHFDADTKACFGVPQLVKAIMQERGLDKRQAEPLSQPEIDVLRRHWRGGSIRNLRQLIEGVLVARDADTAFS